MVVAYKYLSVLCTCIHWVIHFHTEAEPHIWNVPGARDVAMTSQTSAGSAFHVWLMF